MAMGSAIIALRLLNSDDGDESDYETQSDEVMDYLATRLTSFEFSDHAEKRDELKMSFRNEDYAMFDKAVFVKGQKLLATWGWPGDTAPPRRMVVQAIRGGEQVEVTCHCTLSLMDKKKQGRFKQGVTDSEWVRWIADEYRYVGQLAYIETTTARHDITQPRHMTDAQQLAKLARQNGFEFYIDSTGLHWHGRPSERRPLRNFFYRGDPGVGDILEPPKFDANLAKAVTRVRVLGRDPILKRTIGESCGLKDETDVSLGSEDELYDTEDDDVGMRGARVGEESIIGAGLCTEEEARVRAQGAYREVAKNRYKLTLEVIGDARLGAKQLIGLYGNVSQTMSGLYYVKEAITHIAGGAFTMTLNCRKDAVDVVPAAKKRPPRIKRNQNKAQADDGMQMFVTGMTLPDGEVVPAYLWSDDGGKTGQTSQMTEEQFNLLTDKQKEDLRYSLGAMSYPDP